ncbi:MAG: hypothetical protein ABI651_08085 [Verrucomicrobiota bacterium]
MNEPPIIPPISPPAQVFKDRHTGLILFGVLEILLGCFCGLMVPLMIWGQAMSARMTNASTNYRMMLPALVLYGALALAFIWLGVGSIRARRWARALLLIFSWSWLLVGLCTFALLLVFLPRIIETGPAGGQQMPAAAKTAALLFVSVFFSVIFLIIPGAMVLFYRSKQVKATCEARNPVAGWTDACPLPVLAMSLWVGCGALSMLLLPLAYNSVIPFFGVLISGLPGTVFILVLAAVWGYAAWAAYRLNQTGWWIAIATFGVLAVSNVITFAQVDLMEMYRAMGYPEQQIEQIQRFNFLGNETMIWWSLAFLIPIFGCLIYVKKFFRPARVKP